MDHFKVNGKEHCFGGDPEMPLLWYLRHILGMVNPEMVRQPCEGAAVFGTRIARRGEITATHGAVRQSKFGDDQVAGRSEAAGQTDIPIVESSSSPASVGKTGIARFVPALRNVLFAATGKRVRELPLARNGFS
jgi:isoquinoline 1-oxidoreductase beta subunit